MSLEQLRERMPALRQREQTLRAELQAIADQANDRVKFLRLAETLTAFLARLRSAADTLDVTERQRIVRLVIKEILVGDDTIIIRHCIPVASGPRPNDGSPPTPGGTESAPRDQSYLLCKGSDYPALRNAAWTVGFEHDLQQVHHVWVIHSSCHLCQQTIMSNVVKIAAQVDVYDACLFLNNRFGYPVNRFMSCPLGTVSKRSRLEVCLEYWLQYELERPLHHPIPDRRNRKNADLVPVFRYFLSFSRQRHVAALNEFVPYPFKENLCALCFDGREGDPVYSRSPIVLFGQLIRLA